LFQYGWIDLVFQSVETGLDGRPFFSLFHIEGELGDDLDLVEWNALYEMQNILQQHINLLKSSIAA